jgi:hypothetical protein
MSQHLEKVSRWEPIPDVPESPCADFKLESLETGKAKVTLRYSWVLGNTADLELLFADVNAIRTFWDGDGDAAQTDGDPPRCSGRHAGYIWPLLIVEPSAWLNTGHFATSVAIAEAMNKPAWRHYRMLTLERSLDVLARGIVLAHWIPPAA